MSTNELHDPRQPEAPDSPGDIPAERPGSLDRLDVLIGRWEMEAEQHYFDSRGVARVYQMSLDGGVWKVWREAPGFWQRYTGEISDDGTTVNGAWEGSADGREWKHDFGLTYVKVDQAG